MYVLGPPPSPSPPVGRQPALGPPEGPGERALQMFFTEVPAHISAVSNLDHSQFVNPLCLSPAVRINLCNVLAPFKALGLGVYGDVWLRLLDVAEAAGPGTFQNTGSAREYIRIRQQQVQVDALPPDAGLAPPRDPFSGGVSMPSPAQLDGVLQTVLGAFPGLRDSVSQIVASAEAADAAGGGVQGSMNAVVDHVQQLLTGPLLQGLQQQTGSSGDQLKTCIMQIMDGFRGLNTALVSGAAHTQHPSSADEMTS